MPSSAVQTFTDPDDYAALIRNTKAELTVTGRGEFTAKIIRIDLHRLWMQRFSDNLPRVGHSAGSSGRVIVSFRTQPGPSLLWGSTEMGLTNIVRHGEGESTFQRSSGSASWGAMSLPVADAAVVGETLGGCDLTPPRNAFLVTPSPSAMAKLQRLHASVGELAEKAPQIIANSDAAHGLEQALIEAMVHCLVSLVMSSISRRRNGLMALSVLLEILHEWWRLARKKGWMSPGQPWLFPGYRGQHTSARQLHRIVRLAAGRAGITKRVGVHTLRHCFATHLLEQKTDIRVIKFCSGTRNSTRRRSTPASPSARSAR